MAPTPDTLLFLILFTLASASDTADLYKAIQNGDQDAFKEFFNNHYDNIFLYLMNRGMNQQEAEDLAQKAFIYIWENKKNINPGLSLKSYLYRIAYTRMLNHFEQKKDTDELPEQLVMKSVNPEENTEYRELESALKKAIEKMPERRRAVFEHCFIQELSYRETAKVLSISKKSVENHMALAFRDIRESLKIFKKI